MERSILALLKLQKILAIFASPNRYFTKNVKCLGTSRVVYKASCWDCQDFYYTDKTKQRLHDRKTEHFKYETPACIAGGILLPGVLFRRRSGHTRLAVKLHWNTHLNTLTLLTALLPKQYSTPMLILPAMHAGYYEWQSLLCYCQPCHVINGTISKFWQRRRSVTHCKIKETDC